MAPTNLRATAHIWRAIADRIGGRRAMLIGSTGTVIFNVLFGLGAYLGFLGTGEYLLLYFSTVWSLNSYFQSYSALALIKEQAPWLEADGEMHGDAALSDEIRQKVFPGSRLKGPANLLIMPTLDAANIAFNLLKITGGEGITVGPILLGCARAVHILTPSATVRRIVNMSALASVDAASNR